jgi:hypothetical protein
MRMLLVLLPLLSCKSETQAFTEDASEVICSCISDERARRTCERQQRASISESLPYCFYGGCEYEPCEYGSSDLEECFAQLEAIGQPNPFLSVQDDGDECWTIAYRLGPVGLRTYCPRICDF